jgi:DNA primase
MTDTQTIKDKLDIVQIIGEYITLKKAGANWKANCPFHNEKSPSFMVQAEKQIWHCFGCSKGGDVFTFVQEIEGLDFRETLKLLAKRAGVELSKSYNETDSSERNRLLAINTAAAYFFHRMLLDMDASKPAREYLERRGMKAETIEAWQVGFVPDQWDLLTKYLLKKGHGINDLVTAGLTIKRDNADPASGRGYYDRFRGRVMFPICDVHGNVVGFTGRVLVETEFSGGKYVNTPQTPLYDKSRVLYGIHKAKTAIKSEDLAVLVEGQMDVIACHQAGMTNVVAASGTALTAEQIKILKRYTTTVAMAFDADSAGQNAGKRGAGVALEEGMNVKVIQIPSGFAKDADECLKKDKAVWFKAVASATSVMQWYFDLTLRGIDRHDPKKKQQVVNILLAEINRIPFAVERDEWLKRLSDELAIDIDIVRSESRKVRPTTIRPANQASAPEAPKPTVVIPVGRIEAIAEDFWSVVLKFPHNYGAVREKLKRAYFSDPALLSLYETAETFYTKESQLNIDAIRHYFAKEGVENSIDILLLRPYKNYTELASGDAEKEIISLATRLAEEWTKERRKTVTHELSVAEKNGDRARVDELMRELQTL